MADWYLSFYAESTTLAACQELVARYAGTETTTIGELSGNPRDFYGRTVTITAQRGDLAVQVSASEDLRSPDDPEPLIHSIYVRLAGPYATKLAAWPELSAAFATLGCKEHTLESSAAAIIDDARAAGDTPTAKRLIEEVRGALVAQAPAFAHVSINSPRSDVEPILAAYDRAQSIISVGLSDCGLTALPANLERFPYISELSLREDGLDGNALRGFRRPSLEQLTLVGTGLRRITKEDVAGFPALELLNCAGSNLEDLDPNIIDVCPELIRVYVADTPLSRDASRMVALRARWPHMLWTYDDGYVQRPAPTPTPQPIDPELRPYFDTILASPDDDAPRLALAEHLTARGDQRGQQIRLACELAKLEPEDPAFQPLAAQCQVMNQFAFFSTTEYPFLTKQWPGRGFIETIGCTAVDFLKHGDRVTRDAPIRVVDISDIDRLGPRLAGCPALGRLRCLQLSWPPRADRAAILASPYLVRLPELAISDRLDTAETVEALSAELRNLSGLRVLKVTGTISSDAVPALIDLVTSHRLERLDVKLATLRPETLIHALWDKLDDRVRPRRLQPVPFENLAIDLTPIKHSAAQIRELVRSGNYRTATAIRLNHTSLGDEVVALVATSGAFPALVRLNVEESGISDTGVRALASSAVDLDHLECLDLGEGERDKLAVSDAAVEELARSSRLPALRKITRSIEHHVYSDGSRDDTEVIQIRRDDGRVVESVIYHFIWP